MKVIKNGQVLTPSGLKKVDIQYEEDQIIAIGENLDGDEVIDASGKTVLPGLVDVHVHLREPGHAEKETIATGSKAAAHGGFTSIFAMPNVLPYPDDPETMEKYLGLIEKESLVRTYPYSTITTEEAGKEVVDFHEMAQFTRYFSDDGVGIPNDEVMAEAMRKAKEENVIIAMHTEDMKYRKPNASVHDSLVNRNRGYIGIPSACEAEPLKRDLDLACEIGNIYHACHISCIESLQYLKEAKEKGGNISAEVTAHHLLLEDEDVDGPMFKMNPPLRTHADRMALIEGLENGTLDFIANDHAPHTMEEKSRSMEKAPFGIVALETSFPLLYTEFVVKEKRWSLEQLVNWMSTKPAERFGIMAGKIKEGYLPDFTIVDLNEKYTIDASQFESMGKNTPFDGWEVQGKICETIVGGLSVWKG